MASDGYVDRSAMGEAPLGHMPQGQKAGDAYPGGHSIPKSYADANPCDRAMRIDALYQTIERNDLKSEAGEKLMHRVDGKKTESITPAMRAKISPQDYSVPESRYSKKV